MYFSIHVYLYITVPLLHTLHAIFVYIPDYLLCVQLVKLFKYIHIVLSSLKICQLCVDGLKNRIRKFYKKNKTTILLSMNSEYYPFAATNIKIAMMTTIPMVTLRWSTAVIVTVPHLRQQRHCRHILNQQNLVHQYQHQFKHNHPQYHNLKPPNHNHPLYNNNNNQLIYIQKL